MTETRREIDVISSYQPETRRARKTRIAAARKIAQSQRMIRRHDELRRRKNMPISKRNPPSLFHQRLLKSLTK